jgi:hypothetical protein
MNVLGNYLVLTTGYSGYTNSTGQFFNGTEFSILPNGGLYNGSDSIMTGIKGVNEILFIPSNFDNEITTIDGTKNFGKFAVLLKYDNSSDTYYYESSNLLSPHL